MKRVSCYISEIRIKDGAVLHSRPGQALDYLKPGLINKQWLYRLPTDVMVPNESFNVMAAGEITLLTLVKDEETEQFYNFDQQIITDKLLRINVRQFITDIVYHISGTSTFEGFVLADLEF